MNKILYINKKEVKSLLSMKNTLKIVEEAFRQHGLKKVQMPSKIYLDFKIHNGDLRTMPACFETPDIAGVKIVNVHPDNPKKYDIPSVSAIIVLNSTETGLPIVIMDGSFITDMRTGAAGGIAVKYLAKSNSKTVGLIGVGNQAKTQLIAIKEIMNIKMVKIFGIDYKQMVDFKSEMEKFGYNIKICDSVESACYLSDIVITTTPSRNPIVMNKSISEGTHINAIGADAAGKEELDPAILKRAMVVVDDIPQASHSGEVNVPISKGLFDVKDICCELGEVITGKKKARNNDSDITIFDSTGLALQDIICADFVYREAKQRGIGRWIEQ